jgi:hypothetical protein
VRDNAAAIREEFADCEQASQILDFIAAESDRALSSPTGDRKGEALSPASDTTKGRLAIIAGSGFLPSYVAEAAQSAGENP